MTKPVQHTKPRDAFVALEDLYKILRLDKVYSGELVKVVVRYPMNKSTLMCRQWALVRRFPGGPRYLPYYYFGPNRKIRSMDDWMSEGDSGLVVENGSLITFDLGE
jgi:hypothetical protein